MPNFKKEVAWSLGFDLARIAKGNSSEALTAQLIKFVKPTVILDVGANEGQFARLTLRNSGSFKIVSFEPLTSAYELLSRAATKDKRWIVAPRGAIGDAEGKATINVSVHSGASSLLDLEEAHLRAAPLSAYCGTEEVTVQRLDNAAAAFIKPDDRIYLKIDTQGYEQKVLDGATDLIPQVSAIQIEMSFVELYKGEVLAPALISRVQSLGFHVFGFCNGLRDRASGRLLQADGFFIR